METLRCFKRSVQGYTCCSITSQTKEITSINFSPRFLFLILIDQQTCKLSDYNAYSDIKRIINNVLKNIPKKKRPCRNLNQNYTIGATMEKMKKTTKSLRQGAQFSVSET